jgi:hypothetical protein
MIYPYKFPINRKYEYAEQKVFDRLDLIKDNYDIFYSKSFVSDKYRTEYEIDFIIAEKPDRNQKCSVIICMEVKGGLIHYDGINDIWSQNGLESKKNFVSQASSASHRLIKNFRDMAKEVHIEWVLCFPDSEKPHDAPIPNNITDARIIDKNDLLYIDKTIEHIVSLFKKDTMRRGCRFWMYESFKKDLLRDIGFIETLGSKYKYEEEKFIQLTAMQINFFNMISSNKKIIIRGYAGSGKTLIAIDAAKIKIKENKTVLFLCFNRTLANKIRYSFDRDEKRIRVTTFHSLAKSIINESNSDWWDNHKLNSKDFWDLEVPMYLDEILQNSTTKYDVLIIDEGQDFKELWYETLFRLVKDGSYKYIFLDPFQDIFNHFKNIPNYQSYFTFDLVENCRNTKTIVAEMSSIIDEEIPINLNLPNGDKIINKTFQTKNELVEELKSQIKYLVNSERINSENILLMLNSDKSKSSINNLDKIGRLKLSALNRNSRFQKDNIHFTNINVFKGLEVDVLFIVDAHLITSKNSIYTQISRSKKRCYIYSR